MISTSIKFSGGNIAGLGQNSRELFAKNQMQRLGEFAIKTVKARVSRGVGSDDSTMPALKVSDRAGAKFAKGTRTLSSYAQWKSRQGLQPIRDLTGTGKDGGHMLDNLTVRSVTETSVRVAFTARKARIKALANEKRTPWLSLSDGDQRAIMIYAALMFRAQVEIFRRQISQRRAA